MSYHVLKLGGLVVLVLLCVVKMRFHILNVKNKIKMNGWGGGVGAAYNYHPLGMRILLERTTMSFLPGIVGDIK